jgi:hypothetical protein
MKLKLFLTSAQKKFFRQKLAVHRSLGGAVAVNSLAFYYWRSCELSMAFS